MSLPKESDLEALDKAGEPTVTLPYDTLKDAFNKYTNNVFTTIGIVILAIGWIVNSPESREFLEESSWAYYSSLAAVLLIWLIHVVVLLGAHRASRRLTDLLRKKHHIGPDYTFYYEITRTKVGGSILLDSILFCVLFVLICSLR